MKNDAKDDAKINAKNNAKNNTKINTKINPTIQVSPTEPAWLKRLGKVSSVPESFGVDFFWVAAGKKIGVQRKELADLRASVIDGRLSKQLGQMESLDLAVVIVEGMIDSSMLMPAVWSIATRAWIWRTTNAGETYDAIESLRDWSVSEHGKFRGRTGKGNWGSKDHRSWGIWLLSCVPTIGPKLAENIWDHFGGLPLTLTASKEEFRSIPGLGEKKIKYLFEAFGDTE